MTDLKRQRMYDIYTHTQVLAKFVSSVGIVGFRVNPIGSPSKPTEARRPITARFRRALDGRFQPVENPIVAPIRHDSRRDSDPQPTECSMDCVSLPTRPSRDKHRYTRLDHEKTMAGEATVGGGV